ncbi:MAG: hypothetical protein ACRDRG_01525 [Pseudonocardiaceae bacterium]
MAVINYRTQDGLADYGFSIEFQPGIGWRVYVMFDSFPQGQNDSLQLPYQSFDDKGRRYVDWQSELNSLGDARTVAELWAELAERYQRVQEEHELFVELIRRCQGTQARKRDDNEAANDPSIRSGPSTDAA